MNRFLLFLFTGCFLPCASAAEPPITAVAFAPDGESVAATSPQAIDRLGDLDAIDLIAAQ